MQAPKPIVTLGAALAVVVFGLLPVFGDPRFSPVTHAEWARLLLRGLEMDEALATTQDASAAFATLSWKNSLAFRADRYQRGDGVMVVDEGGVRRVVAVDEAGAVAYPLAVPRGGDYRVRVRLAGDPARTAGLELLRSNTEAPAGGFTIVPTAFPTWIEAGVVHLDAGVYTASLELPSGTALEALEVAPPCLAAIEPPGGWRPTVPALVTDVAVTALQALEREDELPPADLPIDIAAATFQVSTALAPGPGSERAALRAGAQGIEATAFVDLPRGGLYTISTFGVEGAGQSWRTDTCLKTVVCPRIGSGAEIPSWRTLTTAPLTAGRHAFSVALAPGSSLERLRLQQRKAEPEDYLAALRRLGFDPGVEGVVARDTAHAAMEYVRRLRGELQRRDCGDSPATLVAQAQGTGGARPGPGPGGTPPGPPPGLPPGPPPITPPVVPPQPPASPVLP